MIGLGAVWKRLPPPFEPRAQGVSNLKDGGGNGAEILLKRGSIYGKV